MKETMFAFIQHYGYAAVIISMIAGIIGLPLPIEILLVFAGSAAAVGKLSLIWLIAFAWLGAVAGMNVNFWLGRFIGIRSISKITKWVHLNEERLQNWADRFQKSGPILIVAGYFIAGLRHASPLLAGASGMTYKRFMTYASGGALLWITLFTVFGQKFGHHLHIIMKWLHQPVVLAAVIVSCVAAFFLKKWVFSSFSNLRSVK